MKTTLKIARFYCKASQAETTLQNEESQFYQTLTQNYNTQFANQAAILQSLTSTFEPILQAGPGQYGFSTGEDTALRTEASDSVATGYRNAGTALNDSLAARGGGNTYLPSGANAQLNAGLATSAAAQSATENLGITQAGYQQGLENFDTAAQALSGAASQYNPLGYAGASTNANQAAFNEADIIQQQNSAWEGELGGIFGGIAGSALGAFTGGLGMGLGGNSAMSQAALYSTPASAFSAPLGSPSNMIPGQ